MEFKASWIPTKQVCMMGVLAYVRHLQRDRLASSTNASNVLDQEMAFDFVECSIYALNTHNFHSLPFRKVYLPASAQPNRAQTLIIERIGNRTRQRKQSQHDT